LPVGTSRSPKMINAGLSRLQVRQTQRPSSVSTVLIHGPEYPYH